MEEPGAERENAGVRWRQLAATLRQHLRVTDSGSATAQALVRRYPAVRTRLEEIRGRVRQFSGRFPLPGVPRIPGAAPAATEDMPTVERPTSFELDGRLQQHLERFLRVRLPKIQVHTSPVADRVTRRVGADAVTTRNVIYFRQGAFQPGTPKGAALLAHEATHVAVAHGARFPRAHQGEEPAALTNERRHLARREALPMKAAAAAPAAPAGAAAPSAPPFVQTAATGRDLDEPDDVPALPAQLSDAALRSLKADVYRMVLERIRSEFERGA